MFEKHRMSDSPAQILALEEAKLVDTMSTDYANGDHDRMPLAIKALVEPGAADLSTAIALTTGNPARIFPEAVPNGDCSNSIRWVTSSWSMRATSPASEWSSWTAMSWLGTVGAPEMAKRWADQHLAEVGMPAI